MTLHALNEWLDSVRRSLVSGQDGRQLSTSGWLPDDLPHVVFHTDVDGCWIFLSARWVELTGFSTQEAMGTKASLFMHPQDRQRCEDYLRRASSEGMDTAPLLVRLICKGGDSRWIEMRTAAHVEIASGAAKTTGTLSNVGAWVHDAKGLESRYRALKSLVDELPGMAYRCRLRRDWSMEFVSSGCLDLTGYGPAEIVHGEAIEYGDLIHADDRERVWTEVNTAVREQRCFEITYRIVTRDGMEKWAWERGKAVCASTGEVLALEGFITDVTQIKNEEDRLRSGTLFDHVTGLPATPLFMEHIQHALEETRVDQHAQFALLLIHLRHLEPALRRCSPSDRDALARDIYRRIRGSLEAADILCKLDDDRYSVLLEDATSLAELARVTRRLQEQFLSPLRLNGQDLYLSSNMGIALSSGRYQRADQMLRDADIALNRARDLGDGTSEFFDLETHARASALSRLEREFRRAIEQDEFAMYWEPVYAVGSNRIAAIEARLAWEHPLRGLLFSQHYLPMAEEVQFVDTLWEHLFAKASREIEAWKPQLPSDRMAVDIQISGRSLLDADAILRLGEHLLAVKPDSFNLALGIPEGILGEDHGVMRRFTERLKKRDIRLLLDGFGAGQSSIRVLQAMAIDYIRLDRSLLTESDRDDRFTAAIVQLAHALGIRVIAGYIDSAAQREAMLDAGVDFLHGSQVSAPIKGDDALALLGHTNSHRAADDPTGVPP